MDDIYEPVSVDKIMQILQIASDKSVTKKIISHLVGEL
jgi:hypothetical protein